MDTLLESVGEVLLSLGLPGVIIIGLAFTVYNLFKLYAQTQEKRIVEAREAVKAIEANTAAIDTLSDLVRCDRRG